MVSFIGKYHSNEKILYQPNSMRLRAPLRAPMNSERLNLEAGQFRYDIHRLYETTSKAQDSLSSDMSVIVNGSSDIVYMGDGFNSQFRVNFETNPSFEAVTGGLNPTYRTNRVPNPSFEVDASLWAADSSTCTIARSTLMAWTGTASLEVTKTATLELASVMSNGTFPAVISNARHTASCYIRQDAGAPARNATITINWLDAGAASISSTAGTATAVNSSGWTRISVTGTSPANATQARIYINLNIPSSASGEKFYVDAVLMETGGAVLSYFDGATATDSTYGFTYAWTGTAHASASNERGVRTPSVWNAWGGRNLVMVTGGYFGTYAARTNPSYNGDRSIFSGSQITVTAGKQYTISGYVKNLNALDTVFAWAHVTPSYIIASGAASGSYGASITVPALNGWVRVYGVFTCTADGFFRPTLGLSNNAYTADVMLDGVLIEEGNTLNEYFDGSSPTSTTTGFLHAWSGTANASSSIQYGSQSSIKSLSNISARLDILNRRLEILEKGLG